MFQSPCGKFHNLIFRFIDAHKLAVLHLQDPVHVLAHAQIVRDDNPGAVVFMDEICECFHHLEGTFCVERGSWFVCQHHRGVVDEGTRDGNALLLPAG